MKRYIMSQIQVKGASEKYVRKPSYRNEECRGGGGVHKQQFAGKQLQNETILIATSSKKHNMLCPFYRTHMKQLCNYHLRTLFLVL